MMSAKRIVANNIKLLLLHHNMTQAELAARTGSTATSISEWANAKKMPEINNIEKIADALNVPIADLFIDRVSVQYEDDRKAADNYMSFFKRNTDAKFVADSMMGLSDKELTALRAILEQITKLRDGEYSMFNKS